MFIGVFRKVAGDFIETLLVLSEYSRSEVAQLPRMENSLVHSRCVRFANKLAVESEPGLTNVQLMLTYHDLRPSRSKS